MEKSIITIIYFSIVFLNLSRLIYIIITKEEKRQLITIGHLLLTIFLIFFPFLNVISFVFFYYSYIEKILNTKIFKS